MFTRPSGRMLACPDWTEGPLTIVRCQARFSTSLLVDFEGTIGSQGEWAMPSVQPGTPLALAAGTPDKRILIGKIEGRGMVRARLNGVLCNYDFVWRK